MLPLIDSHCHLADAKLRDDVEGVLERAAQSGVVQMISVGAIGPIENDQLTVKIAENHANVFAAIGVHPHDAKDASDERFAALRNLAASKKVVAIGESGLDFFYKHSPQDAQEASLRQHLKLASELSLPIVIHCRDAKQRLVEIVRECGMPPAGGVIHCFTGNADAAREFLALGFHISFSGILTFRTADQIREAAAIVPDDRLMVETDAPYLAPIPHRGKRNEPSFVLKTFEALAQARGCAQSALSDLIVANTRRLFRLPA
ncbi:MAG TPA: TatD family hydrolase [Candidatus Binataceae bacterium]|nr:TatD family hydrolase [Candidatus Binataceae bacterium]